MRLSIVFFIVCCIFVQSIRRETWPRGVTRDNVMRMNLIIRITEPLVQGTWDTQCLLNFAFKIQLDGHLSLFTLPLGCPWILGGSREILVVSMVGYVPAPASWLSNSLSPCLSLPPSLPPSLSLMLSGGSRIQRDNKDEAEIASLAETRNCTVYLPSRLSGRKCLRKGRP